MAIVTLVAVSLGEITQSPRYYEYVSRLAPPGQQGTYMGFAFLPIGIGSLIAGKFGGMLIHHYGEVTHQPERIWWAVTGVGVATAALLWIYDKTLRHQPCSRKVGRRQTYGCDAGSQLFAGNSSYHEPLFANEKAANKSALAAAMRRYWPCAKSLPTTLPTTSGAC